MADGEDIACLFKEFAYATRNIVHVPVRGSRSSFRKSMGKVLRITYSAIALSGNERFTKLSFGLRKQIYCQALMNCRSSVIWVMFWIMDMK